MKNEREFYRCAHCGNVVGFIKNAGVGLLCCGEKMQRLEANTTDAAKEKHVPEARWDGNTLKVAIGSVAHPMTEEHHIEWIATAQGNRTTRVQLSPGDSPTADFYAEKGDVTVYAYCNLHGLWAIDTKGGVEK